MAGGEAPGARALDQTPTWAVSAVCAAIVMISIILEKLLHFIGEWFEKRHKRALYEALGKIKTELMVLGFISLLLTFSQNYIAQICIAERYADTMLPCPKRGQVDEFHSSMGSHEKPPPTSEGGHRRLLWYDRRFLGGAEAGNKGCEHGKVPMISVEGLHQLHIFIFFLACFHVFYSALTMALGRLKTRGWKDWENEAANGHESLNDPARFRLTHETSFVKGHMSFWTKTPVLFYIVCFFRQFFRSVRKSDYLTMRHGFISVHLAPGTKFNFQKYIRRSLEDDFKVVVGISPLLWCSVVFFLLINVHGWDAMLWISILPLVVILAVGTKLQSIISQMALEIQERHAVVQGIPLVKVSDKHFWFHWPQLILFLIHFVLFQNAFELTYFFWIWYEYGLNSCFHEDLNLIYVRVALGVGAQFLCSYITLPLYALVTQMGSTMKKSIFDEQTNKALKQWRKGVGKKKNEGKPEAKTLGGSPNASTTSKHKSQELIDIEADAKTANIMAIVDLNGDEHHTNQRDLLS